MDMGNAAGWAAVGAVLLGQSIGIVMWVMGQISAAKRKQSDDVAAIHGKIDDVKDRYVRRDDLEKDMERIERGQKEMRTDIVAELRNVGAKVEDLQIKVARAINGHGVSD